MTVQREDLNQDPPDDKNDVEDKLALEREATEKRVAEAEKRAQDAEVAKARAEGEAEAMRRQPVQQQAQVTQWSEDQWQAEAVKNGFETGAQLKAAVGIADAIASNKMKGFEDKLSAAQKEAREAKEEAQRAKAGNSVYAAEQSFYAKNPALVGYQGDIDAFLAKLPASTKEDPKAFAEALDMAKTYVRGKAREGVLTRRSTQEKPNRQGNEERQEFQDDTERERVQDTELDTSDLDNEGARSLVERLHKRPGPDYLAGANDTPLADLTLDEAYKRTASRDGRGVSIDERADWARGNARSDRSLKNSDTLGGKRGK